MASQTDIEMAALDTLPSEILLNIFSEVRYQPSMPSSLRLVNRRFNDITQQHEHCIASKILSQQFDWAPRQFPGLLGAKEGKRIIGWDKLANLFHRIAVLSNIKSRCKIIRDGHSEGHTAWTTCRALTFHHTGLLLLYRLSDCNSHAEKAALLQSLPVSSLAVMLFTLMVSVHLLRATGPQMTLYYSNPPVSDEARSDIELACEELLLRDGPDFLLGLLMHESSSIESLKTEISSMDARQLHDLDGPPPQLTLIATMRQSFAALVGCEMRYNLVHMWYVLDERCGPLVDPRDEVARKAMEKVVNGEKLEVRCARCMMLDPMGM